VLGIGKNALAPYPIQNATTSRTKTLIPLLDVQALNSLKPQLARIEQLCEDLNSTGLYPYAVNKGEAQLFEARQFPKSSGYPEDAATGIAATALTFGLLKNGLLTAPQSPVTIRQGFAMGKPSQIKVTLRYSDGQPIGCWLTGSAERSVAPRTPA
jgi:PhzF family phenazine biosynthesis protein